MLMLMLKIVLTLLLSLYKYIKEINTPSCFLQVVESRRKPRFRLQNFPPFYRVCESKARRQESSWSILFHIYEFLCKKRKEINSADYKSRQSVRCSTAHAEWTRWVNNFEHDVFGRRQRCEFCKALLWFSWTQWTWYGLICSSEFSQLCSLNMSNIAHSL